jgi:hypothetical protein
LKKRKRAEVTAFMWGREPRGARRGQTGPKGAQKSKRALRRAAPGVADTKHGRRTQPFRTWCWSPLLPGAGPPCGAGPLNAPAGGSDGNGPLSPSRALAGVVALCRSACCRAVVPWLAWRSAEAHAAVLHCPGWRGGALQKRMPPCCCALAGVVALCRSARRRASLPWLALWPLSRAARRLAKAVFLIHRKGGWRGLACAHGGLGAS